MAIPNSFDILQAVIEAWSGLDAFRGFATGTPAAALAAAALSTSKPHESSLLNGPRLPKENGHATQEEIDALFRGLLDGSIPVPDPQARIG